MATTPEILQERFNMEASSYTKRVARSLHAYTGDGSKGSKRRYLATTLVQIMEGTLPAEGRSVNFHRPVNQQQLAEASGLAHRSSYTRRLSRFANRSEYWENPENRKAHARNLQSSAIAKLWVHQYFCEQCKATVSDNSAAPCTERLKLSKRVGEVREVYAVPPTTSVLLRERTFGRPNRYHHSVDEVTVVKGKRRDFTETKLAPNATADYIGVPVTIRTTCEMWSVVETDHNVEVLKSVESAKAGEVCAELTVQTGKRYHVEAVQLDGYHFPDAQQLAAQKGSGAYWDAGFDWLGTKEVSCWVWDARIMDPDNPTERLGDSPRIVMTALEELGLMDDMRDLETKKITSPKGFLKIKQKTVAAYCGMDVKTVKAAINKWEALGVLRMIHDHVEAGDSWYSGPMRILYLPIRRLTETEAQMEQARMASRVREIVQKEGAQRLEQLRECERLGNELLTAWTGQEHCKTAFYRELTRRLHSALIFPDLIYKFIPPTRPPDPERR